MSSTLQARSTAAQFSDLVVFGASYCDDGHSRSPALAGTLTPTPYDGGRYSNGPIFAEYLAQNWNASTHNYAIGGAVNDQSISPGRYANSDEIALFTSNLVSKQATLGEQTLVITWSGINAIKDVYDSYAQNKTAYNWQLAFDAAEANAQAIQSQFTTVQQTLKGRTNATFLILPIPPLEDTPQIYYGAENNRGHSPEDLQEVANLVHYYNLGLYNGTADSGNASSTFLWYDAYAWWKDVSNATVLKNTTYPCLTSASDTLCAPCRDGTSAHVCDDALSYLYWDALHPTTAVHKLLAEQLVSRLATVAVTSTGETITSSADHARLATSITTMTAIWAVFMILFTNFARTRTGS